jgi:hypothetical protein
VRASAQIIEYLDGPKQEDRYHRTELDSMRLGDVSTDRLQHYLACRRRMEEHLDEETVFDELCRLAMQSDEETNDWFNRITKPGVQRVDQGRLTRIAAGMIEDGWAEHQVAYALATLGGIDA